MTAAIEAAQERDAWGPFRVDLDHIERVAELRTLAALVHMMAGPYGDGLARLLRHAERDETALQRSRAALDRLPSLTKRRVLASFASVTWPRKRGGTTT